MAQGADMDFLERKEGSQVLHVRENSDSLMNSLFDSVLKKQESSMPLTVPLSMRKLPKSFFNPPQHGSRSSSISHSRNSSTDSTHAGPAPGFGAAGGQGNHMRAHSSPATLQQTYAAAQQLQQHAHLKQQSYDFTDELGPLPHGWERACTCARRHPYEGACTNRGQPYFINHITQTTTWEDPRKEAQQQQQQQAQQQAQQQQQQQQAQQQAQQQQQQSIFHQQQVQTPTSQPQASVNPQQQQQQQQDGGQLPPPPPQSVQLQQHLQQLAVGPGGQPMGPLPDGWERAETDEGEVYFINHQTRTTSWFDPRIPEHLQRPAALQLQQAAGMSTQALQQRQQTLRLQRLQVERERLKLRQRMVMNQHFPNNQLAGDAALQSRLAQEQSGRGVEDEVNRTREALLRHSLHDIQETPGSGGTVKPGGSLESFLSGGGAAADYHSRQESADSGVGLNSNYSLPHTPEDLLSPMDDQMDAADDPAMASMVRDTGMTEGPDLAGLAAEMDSDDLVPTIQQLDSAGLMSNDFLNDVTSIINANRMGNNSHTWL